MHRLHPESRRMSPRYSNGHNHPTEHVHSEIVQSGGRATCYVHVVTIPLTTCIKGIERLLAQNVNF